MKTKGSGHSIKQASEMILQDYSAWLNRGLKTGDWRQSGVFYLRSPAGVGKTEIIFQMCEAIKDGVPEFGIPALPYAGKPVQLYFNAAMDPESIAGTPAPTFTDVKTLNGETKRMRSLTMHYRSELLDAMTEGPGCILFCDEVGRDAPHMRPTQLKLLSPEKSLAGLDCRMMYTVMAGNTSDDNHRVDDISSDAAFASRIIPIDIVVNTKEWADWMYERGRETYRQVANFILDNPTLITGRDDEANPNSQFHSPRSWEVVADKLQIFGGDPSDDSKPGKIATSNCSTVIAGAIGKNATGLLMSYLSDKKPLTVTDVLAGNFKVERDRVTVPTPASLIKGIQHILCSQKLTKAEAPNLAKFLSNIPADIAESINREASKMLAHNLTLLASHNVFGGTLKRARALGE